MAACMEARNSGIIAIPKTQTPTSFNELRPISMSTLWSKLLESFVAEFTISETKSHWKGTQHGGLKGSSTEHVLIETWDSVRTYKQSSKSD